jgi:hypothetical protein
VDVEGVIGKLDDGGCTIQQQWDRKRDIGGGDVER